MPAQTNRKTPKCKADLKVIIIGEKSVGKTCFIRRYLERKFADSTMSTIGAAFFLKQWGEYNIAIWDTAGEERFNGLTSFYFRGAGATLLAFDLTDEKSFEELKCRFVPLLEAKTNCLNVLVGTKADLINVTMREVQKKDAEAFAKSLNPSLNCECLPYFETSSVSGENVDEAFEFIFQQIFSSQKKNKRQKTVNIKQDIVELEDASVSLKPSSRCCRS